MSTINYNIFIVHISSNTENCYWPRCLLTWKIIVHSMNRQQRFRPRYSVIWKNRFRTKILAIHENANIQCSRKYFINIKEYCSHYSNPIRVCITICFKAPVSRITLSNRFEICMFSFTNLLILPNLDRTYRCVHISDILSLIWSKQL